MAGMNGLKSIHTKVHKSTGKKKDVFHELQLSGDGLRVSLESPITGEEPTLGVTRNSGQV